MATIQLGNTKIASKLITYCEKKAIEKEGVECTPEYAKSEFKATRELWNKTNGVQAHHVIQSFKPGEIDPAQANKIGLDLAKDIAKGHQAVVYTHADKDHIHNHIVINAVSHEDGKKYQSKMKDLYRIRERSDELCKDRGLSIVKEPSAKDRYHRAEYGLAKRGEMSWKDEIREVIKYEKECSKTYDDFKKNLTEKYGIEVKERGKHISFKHPDHQRFVRGKTLGLDYERGTIENGFSRQIERDSSRGARESTGEHTGATKDLLLNRRTSEIDSSRAGDTNKSNQQGIGGKQNGQREPIENATREREGKSRADNQIERDIQRGKAGDGRSQSNEPTRDRKELQSNIRGQKKERGNSQGNDKTNQGHGIHSKADTQPIMEGKGETIRSTAANNNRIDSPISRSIPVGEPFGEILKSLSNAIQKANSIEKAKTEQQQKALQKQKQMEKATPARSRDYHMER